MISNKQKLSVKLHTALEKELPEHVHLWRRDSAWNCGSVMIEMLEAIATSVHSWKRSLPANTCHGHMSCSYKQGRAQTGKRARSSDTFRPGENNVVFTASRCELLQQI